MPSSSPPLASQPPASSLGAVRTTLVPVVGAPSRVSQKQEFEVTVDGIVQQLFFSMKQDGRAAPIAQAHFDDLMPQAKAIIELTAQKLEDKMAELDAKCLVQIREYNALPIHKKALCNIKIIFFEGLP